MNQWIEVEILIRTFFLTFGINNQVESADKLSTSPDSSDFSRRLQSMRKRSRLKLRKENLIRRFNSWRNFDRSHKNIYDKILKLSLQKRHWFQIKFQSWMKISFSQSNWSLIIDRNQHKIIPSQTHIQIVVNKKYVRSREKLHL